MIKKLKKIYGIFKIILLYIRNDLKNFFLFDLSNLRKIAFIKRKNGKLIRELNKNGFYVINNYLDRKECLESLNLIKENFEKYGEFVKHAQDKRIFGIQKVNKLASIYFKDKNLLNIGEVVNKENTYCAFTLLNWLKDERRGSSGEGWHRDSFLSQYKTILYLTDVNKQSGPFQIMPKSHKLRNILKLMLRGKLSYLQTRYQDAEIKDYSNILKKKIKTITGKAGTLIIFNSSTIHRGKPIIKGERLALTNYYYPISRSYELLSKKFNPISLVD